MADCHWAIEKNTAAAKAFKSNYPDAAVFTDDCNLLLSAVMNVSSSNYEFYMPVARSELI